MDIGLLALHFMRRWDIILGYYLNDIVHLCEKLERTSFLLDCFRKRGRIYPCIPVYFTLNLLFS